ncbi:hypothetical protein MJ749_20645 [Paenibacillus polymyxa]|uniref:hypothetical protein n=1 Tax=Paenibacillus polymyxa TaxID=1406 RepID=UPI001249A147|nr:hypothetical protein [Paenibacillus polymyxa]UMR35047.1 hypothetical protein MJ749_20645 [Paenibacillus polymyxa]
MNTSDQSCFAGVEQWNQFGSTRMDLVTEAKKSNTVAYERHGTPAKDRGRYRKRGQRWCLAELF